jgi:phosphinothricin acetyltransferase
VSEVVVRALVPADWDCVASIYRQGIETGDATFETRVPTWAEWDAARLAPCRLVATIAGYVLGFAALSPVSSRAVYAGVAEVMVYVAESARGQGMGSILLCELVDASEKAGLWTLQAGIFPENGASIAIHEAAGFRVVGTRHRVGHAADGRWRDVVLMERRSPRVGVEP